MTSRTDGEQKPSGQPGGAPPGAGGRLRIAVIQGGPSTEAEVSRVSARSVARGLVEQGHEVELLELDQELPTGLARFVPDVVFPVTHGALGEDGCLQGLLEVLGYPYVGSGVRSCALAADKVASKVFFRARGLPIAEEEVVSRGQSIALVSLRARLGPELIVKPASGGSTIGITRLLGDATEDDLFAALRVAHELDPCALVERYVRGRELTCAVLEDENGPRALPPTLILAQAADWYDFESKYGPGGSHHQCPAPLDEPTTAEVQRLAVLAHLALGARDLSRVDFILPDAGGPVLLELNSLPGMTDVSLFPEAARAAGIGFSDLVDRLARRARARGVEQAGARRLVAPRLPGT